MCSPNYVSVLGYPSTVECRICTFLTDRGIAVGSNHSDCRMAARTHTHTNCSHKPHAQCEQLVAGYATDRVGAAHFTAPDYARG